MSRTLDMSDVYDLVDLNQQLHVDSRRVKPEQKERFVVLATRAEVEGWADKVLGGDDVLPDIIETRNRVEQRLKNKQMAA